MNRLRIVHFDRELLLDLLRRAGMAMPDDTRIVGVSDQVRFMSGDISFKLESDLFDPVPEGNVIPTFDPTFTKM